MVKKVKKIKKNKGIRQLAEAKRNPKLGKKQVVPKGVEPREELLSKNAVLGRVPKIKIKVVGIGGGGNSIVSEIAKLLKKAEFIAANTDTQALTRVPKECKKFVFGQDLTGGLGCGMDSVLGEKAAQSEREKIKEILRGADFCILVSSLGGGVGSGAAPVWAEISRELKNITVGIFTLPFKFEGEKKYLQALNSLKKMKGDLNAIFAIPNEKIFQIIDKATPLKLALFSLNQRLAFILAGLIEMIDVPGLINIDWADFKAVFEGKGKICYLNRAEWEGLERAQKAAKEVVQSPLVEESLEGAERILFNIEGNKNLKMQEVEEISRFIFNSNKKAKIIFGISLSNLESSPKIGITLLGIKTEKARKLKKVRLPKHRPFTKEEGGQGERVQENHKPLSQIKRVVKKKVKKVIAPKKEKGVKKEKEIKKAKAKEAIPEVSQKETIPVSPRPKRDEGGSIDHRLPQAPSDSKHFTPLEKSSLTGRAGQDEQKEPANPTGREKVFYPAVERPPKTKRKNALALKREVEKVEKEILAEEKKWEAPAFLRKKAG